MIGKIDTIFFEFLKLMVQRGHLHTRFNQSNVYFHSIQKIIKTNLTRNEHHLWPFASDHFNGCCHYTGPRVYGVRQTLHLFSVLPETATGLHEPDYPYLRQGKSVLQNY